ARLSLDAGQWWFRLAWGFAGVALGTLLPYLDFRVALRELARQQAREAGRAEKAGRSRSHRETGRASSGRPATGPAHTAASAVQTGMRDAEPSPLSLPASASAAAKRHSTRAAADATNLERSRQAASAAAARPRRMSVIDDGPAAAGAAGAADRELDPISAASFSSSAVYSSRPQSAGQSDAYEGHDEARAMEVDAIDGDDTHAEAHRGNGVSGGTERPSILTSTMSTAKTEPSSTSLSTSGPGSAAATGINVSRRLLQMYPSVHAHTTPLPAPLPQPESPSFAGSSSSLPHRPDSRLKPLPFTIDTSTPEPHPHSALPSACRLETIPSGSASPQPLLMPLPLPLPQPSAPRAHSPVIEHTSRESYIFTDIDSLTPDQKAEYIALVLAN
ncbi:hypothetical protein KEM52_003644, partial [Ascosphaera acerosa]